MIAPGDVLRNRYRIEHSIGRGGMGEVFSAVVLVPAPGNEGDEDATLLRPSVDSFRVAVKVVSRAVVSDASMARLEREAVAASRIRSAFVPELIDVGTTPEGEVFLAMEILYGETLSARLKGRSCMPWEKAFLLGDDVLSALIDAHAAGVIHRDLKPSNIFLCRPEADDAPERAKILDFGVCKIDAPDDDKLTGTGESVGTVSYMAPEQIRGASHVTLRADLYSFATVIFEALSGQLPHSSAGQMAMLASKLERDALRLEDVAQVPIPAGLDALLGRLLAREASMRFSSAREVQAAWRTLGIASVSPKAMARAVPGENALLPSETGITSGVIDVGGSGGVRVGLALAAFSVVVSLVVIGLVIVAAHGPEPSPSPDFTSSAAPEVSTLVVERPSVVPTERSAPSATVGDKSVEDAGGWRSEDAGVSAPATKLPAPRIVRVPPRVPVRSPTTGPHIAEKPRY